MTINIASSAVVFEVLRNDNYENWSACLKSYLLAQDLWDIIEPTEDGVTNFKDWRRKNAAALHAIQISCVPDILSQIREISSAKIAWDALAKMHETQSLGIHPDNTQQSPKDGPRQSPEAELGNISQQSPEVSPAQSSEAELEVDDNEYLEFQPLYHAIKKGDWDVAMNFIEPNPDVVKAKITSTGMTALHVACIAGHLKIVEKLVQFMSEEDLEIQNEFGLTVLCDVALRGTTKIAECLIKKNKNLARIKDNAGNLPIIVASLNTRKDMTRYLYSVTPIDLLFPENDNQGAQLLVSSIRCKISDVALDLLRRCPRLTTARTIRGTIPLVRLASMPSAFPSGNRLTFWQQWIYSSIHIALPPASNEVRVYIPQNRQSEEDNIIRLSVSGQLRRLVSNLLKFIGIKEIYDMKWTHLHALELLHCMCQELSTSNLDLQCDAVFEATKNGIIEFIIKMSEVNPTVVHLRKDSKSIFMYAIIHRQEKIFSLLYGVETMKNFFIAQADKSYNTMFHIVGMLAPTSQLARISGAALQMQKELQWYKEVESFMNPSLSEALNSDNETPRQVFTRNHEKLLKEGEKWMKETATSYTIVGALIITIMFAAAFTIPGGNDQNTGFPIFVHKKFFMVFIISDAISLFSSSTSVLMFLGILTSRYTEDDFLKSLPTKLIIGLSTLFVSITAMMVAFSAALLVMLEGQLQIVIPIVSLAIIPVTLFLWLQFPLLIEIFMSTYGPSIFDRKMKPWL